MLQEVKIVIQTPEECVKTLENQKNIGEKEKKDIELARNGSFICGGHG